MRLRDNIFIEEKKWSEGDLGLTNQHDDINGKREGEDRSKIWLIKVYDLS